MKSSSGMTLIEIIITMVILAASVPPLLVAYGALQERNAGLLPASTAIQLAGQKMEEFVRGKSFENVLDQPPSPFSIPFSDYQYEVAVDYVNESNLDLSVDPAVTDFKKVVVSIRNSQIPNLNVTITTLVVNTKK